jgi:hypothetical protein
MRDDRYSCVFSWSAETIPSPPSTGSWIQLSSNYLISEYDEGKWRGEVEYKEYICVQMDYEKREAFLDGLRLTQCALESTTYFTLRVEIRFQLILLSRNGI